MAHDEKDNDERRLFYVALTRAKESVTITYAKEGADHREMLPSQFIEEIKSDLIEEIDSKEWEEKFQDDKRFLFSGGETQEEKIENNNNNNIKDKQFVKELFEKQGLSPTALNNYLECPWKYFYQNLIRIPAAQTIHQHYGIAVHGALQDFFKRMKEEEPSKVFLIEAFTFHLHKLPVSPKDTETLLEKGEKALSGWYDEYENTFNPNVITEFRVIVGLDPGIRRDDTQIKLTGVIDKLEFIEGDIVNVVDYKTGKPKTKNEIMGKTKDASGNYYRQLVFYKLLLSLFNDGKYSMQSGTLDFIEPDDKGKYHKEIFEITSEEVTELTKTIVNVSDEIIGLKFWNKKCDDAECEFCRLRNLVY